MLAGGFPARDASGAFSNQPAHVVAAFMSFLGAGVSLVFLGRRMAGDPRWRTLAGYAIASGIAIVALFLTMGAVAIPPDALLHPWLGLLQRLTLAVWFPATIILAFGSLRIAAEVRTGVSSAPGRTTTATTT